MSDEVTLVYLDDDLQDIFILKTVIEDYNRKRQVKIVFDSFTDPDEFFKRVGQGAKIDLMLVDINMPYVSGLDILKILKEHERIRIVPIIVYSGSNADIDKNKAFEHGANAYISKKSAVSDVERDITALLHIFCEQ